MYFFQVKLYLWGHLCCEGKNIYNFNCPCWRFVFEDYDEGWIRVGLLIEIRHIFVSIRVRRMVDLTFQLLHEATVFPKLNLRNVSHLVRIRAVDEWKTAFNISLGHFEYLVMRATFQALVNVPLFSSFTSPLFSGNLEEHVQHCEAGAEVTSGEQAKHQGRDV